MHPDQNKINQIFVKVKSKSQIPSCLTELTGIVQKDLKATGGNFASPETKEYFNELKGCVDTCLNKVSDPTLKTELKSQISSFIATQQKGGSGKSAHY